MNDNENSSNATGFWRRVWDLYADGFRRMTVGRSLWLLIAVKVLIFFGVLRLFFFPNVLKERYDSDAERAEAVRSALTAPRQDVDSVHVKLLNINTDE